MLNILLVDDNLGDKRLFLDAISETGLEFRLRNASSGREALVLIKQEKPDLLVLDIEMPGMSGYDVCNALKFDPTQEKGIPILLLTVRHEEIDPRIGKLMKVYYLQKPCGVEELKQIINKIFGN